MWSAAALTFHFTAFPFVKYLGENRWPILLPCDDKSRLLRVAFVFDVGENERPALAQKFIKFAARPYLSGQSGFLDIQFSSTSLFFVKP